MRIGEKGDCAGGELHRTDIKRVATSVLADLATKGTVARTAVIGIVILDAAQRAKRRNLGGDVIAQPVDDGRRHVAAKLCWRSDRNPYPVVQDRGFQQNRILDAANALAAHRRKRLEHRNCGERPLAGGCFGGAAFLRLGCGGLSFAGRQCQDHRPGLSFGAGRARPRQGDARRCNAALPEQTRTRQAAKIFTHASPRQSGKPVR